MSYRPPEETLEPEAALILKDQSIAAQDVHRLSIAISLKRIADVLEWQQDYIKKQQKRQQDYIKKQQKRQQDYIKKQQKQDGH